MYSILLLTLTVSIVSCAPVEQLSKSLDFDHYVFTQEYPAGVCLHYIEEGKGYRCSYPANATAWTIHGLWPTYGTTKGPNFCRNVTFNPASIQSLVPQLVSEWTNMLNYTAFYDFWSHEYTKHGSCSNWDTEFEFFSNVLDLFQKIKPFSVALSAGGIEPDSDKGVDAQAMRDAFSKKYGVRPQLQCAKSKSGDQVIQQIEMCLDTSFRPMECPYSSDGCSDKQPVMYPRSKYST